MKKFFRRSLACIIAVMMIATSLPFSAITASAETTTSITKDRFGCVTNGSDSRFKNGKFNIVNDAEENNTSAGVLHFDLSRFLYKDITNVTFNVAIESTSKDTQIRHLNYYYSTSFINDSKYLLKDGKETTGTKIGSGTNTVAIDAYLKHFGGGTLLAQTARTESSGSFNVTNVIKNLLLSGKKDLYIIIMHSNAGGKGSTNDWSDTTVNPSSINFSFTYNEYDFNTLSGNKSFIENRIGIWKPQTSIVRYFGTDVGIYSALYTSNEYSDCGTCEWSMSGNSNTNVSAKTMAGVNNIVFAYTGEKSDIQVPCMVEFQKVGSTGKRYKVNYYSPTTTDWIVKNDRWELASAWNSWSPSTNTSTYSGDGVAYISGTYGHDAPGFTSNNGQIEAGANWYGYIVYNGNLSFDSNGLYTLTNPRFNTSVDGYASWIGGSSKYNNVAYTTGTVGLGDYGTTPVYKVFNLEPISNALKDAQTMYAAISQKESNYKQDTLIAYYKSISNLLKLNTANYDFTTDSGANSCYTTMQSLVSEYNTAKRNLEYNILIKRGDGKTFTTSGKDGDVLNREVLLPTNSSLKANNDGTHTKYSWDGVEGTKIDGSVLEFSEKATIEDCSNDGTGKCKYCGQVLLDTSALDSAKKQAEDIFKAGNDDGEYVADTYQNLSDVYNRIKDIVPTSEAHVNSLTSELLEAINTLRKATLTVRLDKQVDETVTKGQPESCTYGEVKEFEVTDGDVEKWVITTDNGTDQPTTITEIRTGDNKITLVITRNVKVVAHISANKPSQQNITKVVFLGRNNAVVAIKYIVEGDSLETGSVKVPAIPFYEAIGWDKTEVVGLENGGEITVRAQYNFNVANADAHKCGIHFEKFAGGVREYNYDSFVKLYGESTYYGMYSEAVDNVNSEEAKTKLLTYFKTDEFYAPHNRDIYVYELPEGFTPTATVGVTGSYSGVDTDAGKKFATFNCKFYVPEGATVLEWGIKATAGGQTRTIKSETKSKRNEYSLKVKFSQSSSISSIKAQAYIIYIDSKGKKTTLLSNNTETQKLLIEGGTSE